MLGIFGLDLVKLMRVVHILIRVRCAIKGVVWQI